MQLESVSFSWERRMIGRQNSDPQIQRGVQLCQLEQAKEPHSSALYPDLTRYQVALNSLVREEGDCEDWGSCSCES